MDYVQNGRAGARAQVEDGNAGAGAVGGRRALDGAQADGLARADLAAHVVECLHMPASQVNHVDVVAHAGAVGRGVVVAEHLDALQLAHGNLRNVGQQVVGDVLRVFADAPGNMGADGVEVAQQHHVPLVVGAEEVGKDALEHGLGLAVGVGGLVQRAGLGDRDLLGFAVHRGGGREDDVLHAVVAGNVEQHQRAGHVVPVVLKGLLGAFAHGLEAGEVDDGVDAVLGEGALARLAVQDGSLHELQLVGRSVGELADAVHRHQAGIGQVVQDNHVVTLFEQLDAGVAADEPCTAGNQDGQVAVLAG